MTAPNLTGLQFETTAEERAWWKTDWVRKPTDMDGVDDVDARRLLRDFEKATYAIDRLTAALTTLRDWPNPYNRVSDHQIRAVIRAALHPTPEKPHD